jgi:hypothetical protein
MPRERTPPIARLVIADLLISISSGFPSLEIYPELFAEKALEADPRWSNSSSIDGSPEARPSSADVAPVLP